MYLQFDWVGFNTSHKSVLNFNVSKARESKVSCKLIFSLTEQVLLFGLGTLTGGQSYNDLVEL